MSDVGSFLNLDPAILAIQIVAFALLFVLLRAYLFRPVLAIMAERERYLAQRLEEGERAQAELGRIDQTRERLLTQAREEGRQQARQVVAEGERMRARIIQDAREDARRIRQRAIESADLERERALQQLRREVAELALLAAQRAVLAPLDEESHRREIDSFIATLEGWR